MKKRALPILAATLFGCSLAHAETYTVDAAHTFPTFEIGHFGVSVQRGRFNKTAGKIDIDRAAKKGKIDISIDAASIDTGLAERDKHLRGEQFFNTDKFPSLSFKSDKITFQGDAPASADGQLTLLGVTRPVTLYITSFNCIDHPVSKKPMCGASASAMIQRSEFGMKAFVPLVADEVRILIAIEAFKD
ncbi:MAG: hypothetical protein AMXMBFR6_06370 [Betaproteobacteria bacterium]|nr:polyisoprenoid-binding protein [Rhodocyclaceae bacterium]MCG3185621.1 Protein YceI [Rhodocyclaceae bacterium]